MLTLFFVFWSSFACPEHQLEWAIAAVTDDAHEQRVLLRIAKVESGNFDPRVLSCEKRGSAGEVTAFQLLIRNATEWARVCSSFVEDARLALERVHESQRACSHLPEPEQLAGYTAGRCSSVEGRRLSRERWVP